MSTRISQMGAAGTLTGTEKIELSRLSATVTITASTISALASDNSFNDSANGFVPAGFAAGMAVAVSGFTGSAGNNIAVGVITSLTAGKMVIGGADGDVIVDDAAGEAVTITAFETVSTTAQAVADLTPTGGGGGGGGVPKNYLVNGHFRWWQDGASFTGLANNGGTTKWTADQWMSWAPGGGATPNYSVTRVAATLAGSAYGMKVQRTAGNTSTNRIHTAQILHSSEAAALAGQTVTFALNIKAGANFSAASSQVILQVVSGTTADEGAATFIADIWTGRSVLTSALKTISATMAQVYVTAAVPAGCRELCVGVEWAPVGTAGADDSITIELAQVTIGSTPGEFEKLPDVVSLLRCQQFYRKTYDPDVAPGTVTNNGALTWASAISGTGTCYGFVGNLGPYMRATPTRTAYSPVTGASGKAYQYDVTADVDVNMGSSFNNQQSWAPTKSTGNWTAGNRIGIHCVENARLD